MILSSLFSPIAYFTKEANPHHATMERVIHTLTEDKDADVRAFFAEPQAYDSDGEPINDISVSFFKWHSYLISFKGIFNYVILDIKSYIKDTTSKRLCEMLSLL